MLVSDVAALRQGSSRSQGVQEEHFVLWDTAGSLLVYSFAYGSEPVLHGSLVILLLLSRKPCLASARSCAHYSMSLCFCECQNKKCKSVGEGFLTLKKMQLHCSMHISWMVYLGIKLNAEYYMCRPWRTRYGFTVLCCVFSISLSLSIHLYWQMIANSSSISPVPNQDTSVRKWVWLCRRDTERWRIGGRQAMQTDRQAGRRRERVWKQKWD